MEIEPRFIIIDDNPIDIIIYKFMIKNELKKDPVVAHFAQAEKGLGYIEKNHSIKTTNKTIHLINHNILLANGYDFLGNFDRLNIKIKEQVKIFILSETKKEIELGSANAYKFFLKPLSEKNISDIIYDVVNK